MMKKHVRVDDQGRPVTIHKPHQPSTIEAWRNPGVVSTATPDCSMPVEINGVPVSSWPSAPDDSAAWEMLTNSQMMEPKFLEVDGKLPAAGVVVVEGDGRVWVTCPTNAYGGYAATFPKGRCGTASLQATAIREAWEEVGLRVELIDHLADVVRTETVTRYYIGRRVGGDPSLMGWESQAVQLVPIDALRGVVAHPNDASVLAALPAKAIVAYEWGLVSGHRVLNCLAGYFERFKQWPTRIMINRELCDGLRDTVLGPRGWYLLNERLQVVRVAAGTVYAEGPDGRRHEYDANAPYELERQASVWLWGIDVVG